MSRALNIALVTAVATAMHAERVRADPTADEIAAMHDKLVVLDDGKQHYLAYVLDPEVARTKWFYGDARLVQYVPTGSSRPDIKRRRVTFGFVDPRYHTRTTQILGDFDTDELVVTCDKRKTTFHPLPAAEAAKVLAKLRVAPPPQRRLTVFLARPDEDTTYYYVDVPDAGAEQSFDFRLFVGKRGAMKPMIIKEHAVDSSGTLLVTDRGKLRYTVKTKVLEWLPTGGKPIQLTQLDGSSDWDLVYNQLGIFTTQRFGTPCDDL